METILPPEVSSLPAKVRNQYRINWKVWVRIGLVLSVFMVSLLVRLRAVEFLPSDYDEDDYLRAGQLYAQKIAAGDISGVANLRENYEHPPMTKLAFGVVLFFTQSPASYSQPVTAFSGSVEAKQDIAEKARSLRTFNAIVGAITAGVVAAINPLAGLLVGLNSWHLKYTSQAMLEALPCLFATITLLILMRTKRNSGGWWWTAAATLGLCAAGKYLYAVGGVAAVIWFLWRERESWRRVLLWVGLALLTFYVADPSLWFNPMGNLLDSLAFNTGYATGTQVQNTGFAWSQPLTWLLSAVPWLPREHPETFPLLMDGVFSILGLVALWRMWRGSNSERLVVLWFGINMLFLFFWPTKWPQYILAVTVPISLAAVRFMQDVVDSGQRNWRQWRELRGRSRTHWKAALSWFSPTILILSIIVLYPLLLQTALASTYFQVGSLRDGAGGLIGAFGRGLLGLPPDYTLSKPIIYSGNGSFFGLLMWEPFLGVIRFNIMWAGFSIALATILGLWLATLLQRKGVFGRQAWRTLFILPWAIPEFVGALIWSTLFDDVNGGVNNFLNVPAEARLNSSWLGDSVPLINFTGIVKPIVDTLNDWRLTPFAGILEYIAAGLSLPRSFWVLVIVGVWVSFPFMMLVSTVALRSISIEVMEAARVDGAKGWNLWRGITWPLIRPSIWAGVLLRGTLLFNAFHIPLMLINNSRVGENNTLANITYLSMRYGSNYSVAALVNVVTMGAAISLIWLFNRQTRVVEGIQYV